ncbi:MAG: calcium/sodium antiporter [Patescibacteria group bacterium]
MVMNVFLLIGGFVLLILGADYLVKGAASIARYFNIRTLVIGLTVVAFGTSAPELVVNLFSALSGSNELAVANILGSNISNILLILGVAALITPLAVHRGTVWKEIPFSLLAAIILVVLGFDVFFGMGAGNYLTRGDGIVLLGFFAIFLYYTFGMSKAEGEHGDRVETYPIWKSILFALAGLVGLVLGGKFIVDSGVDIARTFGVSEHLIGVTIVAVGTSLPELATAIMAAIRKHVDLAIGGIIGSNIFNIFFVLGVTSIVSPLGFVQSALQDGLVVVAVTFALFLSMFLGKKHHLQRWTGGLFVLGYIAYITLSIIRG